MCACSIVQFSQWCRRPFVDCNRLHFISSICYLITLVESENVHSSALYQPATIRLHLFKHSPGIMDRYFKTVSSSSRQIEWEMRKLMQFFHLVFPHTFSGGILEGENVEGEIEQGFFHLISRALWKSDHSKNRHNISHRCRMSVRRERFS